MTGDDDFNRMFGAAGAGHTTFAQRVRPDDADVRDAPPTLEPEPDPSVYRAFGYLPAGFGEACDVQRWLDGTEVAEGIEFQYRFLMEIAYIGEEELRLFLPDCIVVIEGERLRDLRKKLARRQVTFIQQFSPKVWPGGRRQGETLVTRIDIVRAGGQRSNPSA